MDGLEGQEVAGDEAGLLRTESDGRIVKARDSFYGNCSSAGRSMYERPTTLWR